MLAYAVGLGATFCANSVFRSAQPALVYLSPATIGVLYLVVRSRLKQKRRNHLEPFCPKHTTQLIRCD